MNTLFYLETCNKKYKLVDDVTRCQIVPMDDVDDAQKPSCFYITRNEMGQNVLVHCGEPPLGWSMILGNNGIPSREREMQIENGKRIQHGQQVLYVLVSTTTKTAPLLFKPIPYATELKRLHECKIYELVVKFIDQHPILK